MVLMSAGGFIAVSEAGDPTEHDPHVGFRCAQDAPALSEASHP